MANIIKIGHYADVQSILKEDVSYETMKNILHNTVEVFLNNKVDAVILAGDIFDIQNPKDPERELIYKHIVEVLKIPTLKWFGVLLGNHDYMDPNKNKSEYTDSNPIDTLWKTVDVIDDNLKSKFIYLKHQQPYTVPGYNNIILWPYSLEDGGSHGLKIQKLKDSIDNSKLNLTIHHDIVREYVDNKKLPLPKREYDKLISINSDEFFTDIIFGGDIHDTVTINGGVDYPNRIYFYPGNIYQRNFGEGSYGEVRKSPKLTQVRTSSVFIHTIDLDTHKIIDTATCYLPEQIAYLTIDVNTLKKIDNVGEQITKILNDWNPGKVNFIRFKMSQLYALAENQIRNFVQEFFNTRNLQVTIEFVFDKKLIVDNNESITQMKLLTLQEDLANNKLTEKEFEALKMLIVDKLDVSAIQDELNIDFSEFTDNSAFQSYLVENQSMMDNLTTDNVDESLNSMLLTKDKLHKLFGIQLNNFKPAIVKQVGTDFLANEIMNEVTTRFQSELELFFFDRRQYRINLLEAETTKGFCKLGPTLINLDNPGLTKINGSNGKGKSTLYNKIRWNIKGLLFANMNKTAINKNTALVFNINKPENDEVDSILRFKVNGVLVVSTRTAKRIWKPKAINNPSLKSSANPVQYIAKIERSLTLEIFKDGPDQQPTIVNDVRAEEHLQLWFGDTIDFTMLIDKYTIPVMLNKPSNELNDTVMYYLAPYLKPLEENLKSVKESYKIVKPKTKLKDINDSLQASKQELIDSQKLLETVDDSIKNKQTEINKNTIEIEGINNELINLGNIPVLIQTAEQNTVTKQTEVSLINNKISNFVPIVIKPFDGVKPDEVTYQTKIDTNTEILNGHKSLFNVTTTKVTNVITTYNNDLVAYREWSNKQHTDKKTVLINNLNSVINQLNNNVTIINGNVNKTYQTVVDNKTLLLKYLELKVSEYNGEYNLKSAELSKVNEDIGSLTESIENSFCKECNRKFDETDLDHVEANKKKLEDLIIKSTSIVDSMNNTNSLVDDIRQVVNKFNDLGLKQITEHIQTNWLDTGIFKDQTTIDPVYNKSVDTYNGMLKMVESQVFIDFKQLIINLQKAVDYVNGMNNFPDLDVISLVWGQATNAGLIQVNIQPTLNDIISGLNDYKSFIISKTEVDGIVGTITNDIPVGYFDVNTCPVEISNLIMDMETYRLDSKLLEELNPKIQEVQSIINNLTSEYNNLVKQYNNDFTAYNNDTQKAIEHNNSITELMNQQSLIAGQIQQLAVELKSLNEKLPKYETYQQQLAAFKLKHNDLVTEHNNLNTDKVKANNVINTIQTTINDLLRQEQEHIEYIKNNNIYSTYEYMIKTVLKADVFSYYREFLNSTMNLLLSDSKFKLVWHEDGDLYYTEIVDGKISYIPVVMVSGMQTIFLGLSLLFTISTLNTHSNIDTIFIDEISGSLNNGKGLKHTTDIVNYQSQLVKLLFKFGNRKIYIIDHVIENLYETEAYEVIVDDEGYSKYIQM